MAAAGVPRSYQAINIASSGDNTVISSSAGRTIRIYDIFWRASGTVNVTLKDGASTNLEGVHNCVQGDGVVLDAKPGLAEAEGGPHYVLSAGNAFIINLSAAVQVSGHCWYTREP